MEAYGAKRMEVKEEEDWASQRTTGPQNKSDQFSNALGKKKKTVKWLRIYSCGRILVLKDVLVTYCYETIPDRAIYGNKNLFWLTL